MNDKKKYLNLVDKEFKKELNLNMELIHSNDDLINSTFELIHSKTSDLDKVKKKYNKVLTPTMDHLDLSNMELIATGRFGKIYKNKKKQVIKKIDRYHYIELLDNYLQQKCNYILKTEYEKDKKVIALFEQEVWLQKQIADIKLAPQIIKHWYCKQDGQGYIMMEYIPGMTVKSLFSKIKQKDILICVKKKCLEAIYKMNNLGIVHNDLKRLENILVYQELNKNWIIKIIDFGIAVSKDINNFDTDSNDFDIGFSYQMERLLSS